MRGPHRTSASASRLRVGDQDDVSEVLFLITIPDGFPGACESGVSIILLGMKRVMGEASHDRTEYHLGAQRAFVDWRWRFVLLEDGAWCDVAVRLVSRC